MADTQIDLLFKMIKKTNDRIDTQYDYIVEKLDIVNKIIAIQTDMNQRQNEQRCLMNDRMDNFRQIINTMNEQMTRLQMRVTELEEQKRHR